jgi:hypothetical protein
MTQKKMKKTNRAPKGGHVDRLFTELMNNVAGNYLMHQNRGEWRRCCREK